MAFLDRTSERAAARSVHYATHAPAARIRRSIAAVGVWLLAVVVLLAGCSLDGGTSSGPGVVVPSPTIETPEMQAASIVSRMSLDDKLGQMIIIQFNEQTYTPAQAQKVKPFHPGGVILYNYSMGTEQQVKDLLAAGQHDSPIPMFTPLDLEGGYVDRLYSKGYLPMRMSAAQMAAAALKDPTVPEQQGQKTAHDLLGFGFNMDLAPDTDVQLHYSDILAGGRAFGSTPDVVTTDAGGWLTGLQVNGVLGCLKHFPGIGGIPASENPHDTLPTISRTKDQLEATELAPYRALIQSGQAQCIMSTDVLVPALDQKYPSEISKQTITGILRDELHYNGLAITDALYMAGILDTWTFAQAAVLAIEAGNDMIMAPWLVSQVNGIVNGLKAAIQSGALPQAQVDASVTRILALKIRYHLLTPPGSAPAAPSSPTAPASSTPSADVPQPRADGVHGA